MSSIRIILDKCTGCKLCVKACPFGAIEIKDKKAVIDFDKCTLCGACVPSCKFAAIDMKKTAEPTRDLSSYKDVWVFCEQKKGRVQSVSWELLGEGGKLAAKLGSELCAVLIGSGVEKGAQVRLEVSEGPPQVTVPRVVDLPCQQAKQLLESQGFPVQVQFNPEAFARFQNPPENAQVPPGTQVTIGCF